MALSELKNTTQNLPREIESAVHSQIEYYKLYSFRMLAKSATGLVTLFIVGLLALCIMMSLSVAGAFAIGAWLDDQWALGFLIMGFLLLILLISVFLLRKKIIQKPLLRKLSDIYFKED